MTGLEAIALAVGAAAAVAGTATGITSAVQQSNAMKAQAEQADLQARANLAQQQLESQTREQNYRRALAAQVAVFGSGAGVVENGLPVINTTVAQLEDEQRQAEVLAGVQTGLLQKQAGRYRAAAGSTALLGTIGGIAGGAAGAAGAFANYQTAKTNQAAINALGSKQVGPPASLASK
jgi:FAD/FMN-containing dehydrogenase